MFSKRLADKIKTNFAWSVISENGERLPGPERLSEETELNTSDSDALQEKDEFSIIHSSEEESQIEQCPSAEHTVVKQTIADCAVAEQVDDSYCEEEIKKGTGEDVENFANSVLKTDETDETCEKESQSNEDSVIRKFSVVGSWDDVEDVENEKTNQTADHSANGPCEAIPSEFVPISCDISGEMDEIFDNSKRIFRSENVSIKNQIEEKEKFEKESIPKRPNVVFRSAATNRGPNGTSEKSDSLGTVHLPSEIIESSFFLSEPVISRTVSFLSEHCPEEQPEAELEKREKQSDKKAISIEFKTRTDKDRKTDHPKRCG